MDLAMPVGVLEALRALLLLVAAFITYRITVRVGRKVLRRWAAATRSTWDDRLIEQKVFAKLAHAVPAVVLWYGIGPALGLSQDEIRAAAEGVAFGALLVQRVSLAIIVVSAVTSFSALLDAIDAIYRESYPSAASRPIKGYLQVVALVAWITASVVVISILADRSPVVFLSGLGALTAVLMLVFRDTILSFVASIQIMSNDLIRIGDWVEMPQANANGDVIDIALHTVKIQNWDKTISAVPTHKFISESFKNWRGMKEAGGRRIKRSLNLDLVSVRFLTAEEIERLSRYELLRDYMRGKREELEAWSRSRHMDDQEVIPEVRQLTNVGTFRAYVMAYLKAHPRIHKDMTLMVRQLAPTAQGLPIEIYCFTNDTAWAVYEGIQGDIFDHLFAILSEFGLKTFQEPAGADFARLVEGSTREEISRALGE
jgi:miniconductance mechanosensitive channel